MARVEQSKLNDKDKEMLRSIIGSMQADVLRLNKLIPEMNYRGSISKRLDDLAAELAETYYLTNDE